MHTLDEERNIQACLETLAWVDEVVVVDMESTDGTVEIARDLGAGVVSHPRVGYVEPARDFGIAQATCDWVLLVDADERVPPALAEELLRLARSGDCDMVEIPRKNLWLGRWVQHGDEWPNAQRRFFRRGTVTWPTRIHARPRPGARMVTLPPREELALVHHWQESVGDFIGLLRRYSGPEGELIARSPHRFRRRHVLVHPAREFWRRLVRDRGYRDGFDGLVLALLFSVYRLFALLRSWEQSGPRDFGDRESSLSRFVIGVLLDRPPAGAGGVKGADAD